MSVLSGQAGIDERGRRIIVVAQKGRDAVLSDEVIEHVGHVRRRRRILTPMTRDSLVRLSQMKSCMGRRSSRACSEQKSVAQIALGAIGLFATT